MGQAQISQLVHEMILIKALVFFLSLASQTHAIGVLYRKRMFLQKDAHTKTKENQKQNPRNLMHYKSEINFVFDLVIKLTDKISAQV